VICGVFYFKRLRLPAWGVRFANFMFIWLCRARRRWLGFGIRA